MVYIISILFSMLSFMKGNNPEELGKVNWLRDYDKALEQSTIKNKPIIILFQEVPGCSTCKNYGNNILSHPFIVEIIESEFIPLVVYNNKGGKDGEILKKYKEPAWNNPVVRIVNNRGADMVDRLSENYSLSGLLNVIIEAFDKEHKQIPKYIQLLKEELDVNEGRLKESYVSMYCFWTGEKVLAEIKGVAHTEAGYMGGKEVVKIKYNPDIVKYEDILCTAVAENCADITFTNDKMEQTATQFIIKKNAFAIKNYRPDNTQKYYLSNSKFKYLPMTELQASKINSALGNQKSANEFLSPRQLGLLNKINLDSKDNLKIYFNEDFEDSWWKLNAVK